MEQKQSVQKAISFSQMEICKDLPPLVGYE